MIKRTKLFFMLVALILLHVVATDRVSGARTSLNSGEGSHQFLSPLATKLSALEFKGAVSDFLFIRAIVFAGGKTLTAMTPGDWTWFRHMMGVATDLDPYFADPYYFLNGYAAWQTNAVGDVNQLLEKGYSSRTWDALIPFYIGFNNFFYIQDNEKAAEWLVKAALRPGANGNYTTLAARLASQATRAEKAVPMLEELLKNTEDENVRKMLEEKLKGLRVQATVEQAVSVYRKRFGRNPVTLHELISKKILESIPHDPAGGSLYLDAKGQIHSSTELSGM